MKLRRASWLGPFFLAWLMATPALAAEPRLVMRLFKLQHETSNDVFRAVRPLASGKPGTQIEETSAFETISVRDHPENVAAIAQAIRELDVARPDVELHLHILIATADGEDHVPASMAAVVGELKKALSYRAYHAVAESTQRVRAGAYTKLRGEIDLQPPVFDAPVRARYEYKFKTQVIRDKGKPLVQIRGLDFDLDGKGFGEVDINTDLQVGGGETVVVGTATVKDRAVILLVSARVL